MRVWLSNSRNEFACEREFFALLCSNLTSLRGARRVAERFRLLATLASLPWLDQPRLLEPTRLIFEIHEAWEELWALPVGELLLGQAVDEATRRVVFGAAVGDDAVLGGYLARPLNALTVFAASAGAHAKICTATHLKLIASSANHRAWRVIQGGRSRPESAGSLRDRGLNPNF